MSAANELRRLVEGLEGGGPEHVRWALARALVEIAQWVEQQEAQATSQQTAQHTRALACDFDSDCEACQ